MFRIFILFTLLLFLASCSGQTKEEMTQEASRLVDSGNLRGAIVLYRNALEKDADFLNARIGLGRTYFKSGDFQRAKNEFQKVLLQNPSLQEIHLDLAKVLLQLDNPQQAMLQLDEYHSSGQETAESLALYGRAHGAAGDLESAEIFFRKAAALDEHAVEPYFFLGKIYVQKKDLTKAEEYLRKAVSLDSSYAQAYYLLAGILTREGKVAEALETYKALIAADPDQLQAFYMASILQLDAGDLEGAKSDLEAMAERFSGEPEVSRLRGMLLYREGDYEQARVTLEKSIQSAPHVLSYLFLGLSHYNLEQYELALNQFQKALDLRPDFDRARILVASTLLKQKRTDDAIMEIQKVLRNDPDNAHAHNVLGSAYLVSGDYDEGMAELERAVELDPSLIDAHIKRGLFYLSKGEGSQGEADLIKAIEVAPEILNGRLMLVSHYLRQANYSDAIQTLQEGMNGSESDALLNNFLAAAYFSQNKNEEGVDALRKATKIKPDYLTPYFNLAGYFASQSRYEDALEEYRQVLGKDPGNIRALLDMAGIYRMQGLESELAETYRAIEATGTEQGFITVAQYQFKTQNSQESLDIINRGLKVFPNSTRLLEMKGALLFSRNDISGAEDVYKSLAKTAPERGYSLLVQLYSTTGQLEKARALIQELQQAQPGREYPYLLASLFYHRQKQTQEAIAVLNKGIQTVTNPMKLEMQLGRIYEGMGNGPRAEELYRRVIDRNERFSPAYVALGFLKENDGDKATALDYYKKAVAVDQNNVPALNNLAYLLADNFGEMQKALNFALMAYRLEPDDPRIMDTLGYLFMKNDRAQEALKLLERAHKLMPEENTVTLHYAEALVLSGKDAQAKAMLLDLAEKQSGTIKDKARALLKTL